MLAPGRLQTDGVPHPQPHSLAGSGRQGQPLSRDVVVLLDADGVEGRSAAPQVNRGRPATAGTWTRQVPRRIGLVTRLVTGLVTGTCDRRWPPTNVPGCDHAVDLRRRAPKRTATDNRGGPVSELTSRRHVPLLVVQRLPQLVYQFVNCESAPITELNVVAVDAPLPLRSENQIVTSPQQVALGNE